MQKKSKNASILIWAIFLSLIISVSFLSISTKITKNLKNSSNLNIDLEKENKIQNLLYSSNNNSEILWNIEIQIENKKLKYSLKKWEIYKIHFPKNSQINLKLTNSWIIEYNTWTTSSWILYSNSPEISTNINANNNLILKNLAWYSSFKLISNNKFEFSDKKYKIIEKIWNKKIIKSSWILK